VDDDVEEFLRLMGNKLPYKPKAIFPSEMFLFYKLAKDFDANDHIFESGVGYGGSTSYLARLFPRTKITSIDADRYGQLEQLQIKFKRNAPNVVLLKGNSARVLPSLIRLSGARRIAVLIDGPKARAALRLVKRLLRNRHVEFVAVHDLSEEMAKHGKVNSRDAAFRAAYGHLDHGVGEYLNIYPNGPGLTIFTNA
jgi:precorrin-6B methylase 2